ncbi:MAG: DinB family protein, partial [Janthinobacterium sp.]
MSRCAHICLMADYNQWMNAKVYAAAASLPPGELERERGAFFGSLLATLNHVMVGDTLWLQRYAQHPARFPLLDPIRAITPPTSLTQPLFAADDFAAMHAHRQWLDQV